GEVCVMALVIPPAEVTDAVSPVALKVWTRDSAASKRMHPAGFRSGTTRNSMGAAGASAVGVAACGADACCGVQAAMKALAVASARDVPVNLRTRCLPMTLPGHTIGRAVPGALVATSQ